MYSCTFRYVHCVHIDDSRNRDKGAVSKSLAPRSCQARSPALLSRAPCCARSVAIAVVVDVAGGRGLLGRRADGDGVGCEPITGARLGGNVGRRRSGTGKLSGAGCCQTGDCGNHPLRPSSAVLILSAPGAGNSMASTMKFLSFEVLPDGRPKLARAAPGPLKFLVTLLARDLALAVLSAALLFSSRRIAR